MPTVKEVIQRRLKGIKGHVAVAIWQEEDVIEQAEQHGVRLSHKAAAEIIDEIHSENDACSGITWATLDCYIEDWKDKHPHYRRRPEYEGAD